MLRGTRCPFSSTGRGYVPRDDQALEFDAPLHGPGNGCHGSFHSRADLLRHLENYHGKGRADSDLLIDAHRAVARGERTRQKQQPQLYDADGYGRLLLPLVGEGPQPLMNHADGFGGLLPRPR